LNFTRGWNYCGDAKGSTVYAGNAIMGLQIIEMAGQTPPLTVTNTMDSGTGSLGNVIESAAKKTDPDTILFAIPKTDPGFDAARGSVPSGLRPLIRVIYCRMKGLAAVFRNSAMICAYLMI